MRTLLPSEELRARGIEFRDMHIQRPRLPSEIRKENDAEFRQDVAFYYRSTELAEQLHAVLAEWQQTRQECERRIKMWQGSILEQIHLSIELLFEAKTVLFHMAYCLHKGMNELMKLEKLPDENPLARVHTKLLQEREQQAKHDAWRLIHAIGDTVRSYPLVFRAARLFDEHNVPLQANGEHIQVDTSALFARYGINQKKEKKQIPAKHVHDDSSHSLLPY